MATKNPAPGITPMGPDKWKIKARVRVDGQRQEKIEVFHGTLGQAVDRRALLIEMLREGAAGGHTQETTLSGWARAWLVERKQQKRSERTIQIYRKHLEDTVLPLVGHLAPDRIARADLVAWRGVLTTYRRLDGQPYAASTVQTWWWLITSILSQACLELGIQNPARGLEGPVVKKARRTAPPKSPDDLDDEAGQALTGAQVQALLVWTRSKRAKHYLLVLWLFSTGTRQKALRLLGWNHISWEGQTAWVCGKGDRWRMIALSDELLEQLRAHRVAQAGKWGVQELVFLNSKGEAYTDKAVCSVLYRLSRQWKKVEEWRAKEKGVKSLGVTFSAHDARRTWITRALGQGLPISDVAQHAGHKKLQQTLEYTRNSSEVQDRTRKFSAAALLPDPESSPEKEGNEAQRGKVVGVDGMRQSAIDIDDDNGR